LEFTHTVRIRSNGELVKEMGKYKIDVCAPQEIVARERNCDNKKLYDFV